MTKICRYDRCHEADPGAACNSILQCNPAARVPYEEQQADETDEWKLTCTAGLFVRRHQRLDFLQVLATRLREVAVHKHAACC